MTGSRDSVVPLSFGHYLAGAGAIVAVLFAVLDPSPSAGLSLPARLAFWVLHVYGGLGILILVQSWLDRADPLRRRPWLAVTLAGLVGSLLFTPLALGFDRLFGQQEDFDGKGAEELAQAGFSGQLLSETTEMAPAFTITWMVLQIPWLLRLDFRRCAPTDKSSTPTESDSESELAVDPAPENETSRSSELASSFFAALPGALGQDIAALSSELHYLRVKTSRGSALVLYNLKDAIADLEKTMPGFRVHRSHWVARDHVRRLVRHDSGWACELSTGDLVPISRRKARLAREFFGEAAEYRPEV